MNNLGPFSHSRLAIWVGESIKVQLSVVEIVDFGSKAEGEAVSGVGYHKISTCKEQLEEASCF